jgi:hypothetical protein
MNIYPSITTNPKYPWRDKINEIEKLEIKEVALFPTFLDDKNERYELYNSILELNIKCPLVHLRGDFDEDEVSFIITNLGAIKLNLHNEDKDIKTFKEFKDKIFIENKREKLVLKDFEGFAGLCLDLAHEYEATIHNNAICKKVDEEILNSIPIGFCHLSAIRDYDLEEETGRFDCHRFIKLSDFDYTKELAQYIKTDIALELNNPIKEQLQAKEYLESILNIKEPVNA